MRSRQIESGHGKCSITVHESMWSLASNVASMHTGLFSTRSSVDASVAVLNTTQVRPSIPSDPSCDASGAVHAVTVPHMARVRPGWLTPSSVPDVLCASSDGEAAEHAVIASGTKSVRNTIHPYRLAAVFTRMVAEGVQSPCPPRRQLRDQVRAEQRPNVVRKWDLRERLEIGRNDDVLDRGNVGAIRHARDVVTK